MRNLSKFLFKRILQTRKYLKNPVKELSCLEKDQIRRVLVVSSTALGDTLLSLPALKATKEIMPQARITFLVRKEIFPLVKGLPYVDDWLFYTKGHYHIWRLLREITRHNFDLALIFHESDLIPTGLSFLAGVPFILRSGLRDQEARPYLSAVIPYREEVHQIEQRLDVLRTLLKNPKARFSTRMELPVKENDLKMARQKLKAWGVSLKKPFVGVQIGASRAYTVWPPNKIKAFVRLLLAYDPDIEVALLGGKQEASLGKELFKSLGSQRVKNLCGRITLYELPAFIKNLTLMITPDTGPMHVAFAVGTPTICLFVPSEVKHTGPYQDLHLHTVIRKERPCQPCLRKYCPDPWCMNLISPEEVLSVTLKRLRGLPHE